MHRSISAIAIVTALSMAACHKNPNNETAASSNGATSSAAIAKVLANFSGRVVLQ